MTFLRVASATAIALLIIPVAAIGQSSTDWVKPAQAPVGSLQPTAEDFAPGSAANVAEQERLAKEDKQQAIDDKKLDEKLDICRC